MTARHYLELVNFFSRSLRDRDAAADVVQESYSRVLAMRQPEAVLDLRALLYRIGKNIVIDDARARQAEQRMLDTLGLISADSAPSPEREADARQQCRRLAARLAVMPRKRREAFILVRIYGFSHAESALHLATTVAAIEKHIVRAVCDLFDLATLRAA